MENKLSNSPRELKIDGRLAFEKSEIPFGWLAQPTEPRGSKGGY